MRTWAFGFLFAAALLGSRAFASDPPEIVAGIAGSVVCPVESGVLATKTTVNAASFTFSTAGDLYIYDTGCSPATLRKIDAATGIISTLPLLNPPVGQFSALAFDPNGVLYLASGSGGSVPGIGLFRIEPNAGALTLVYPMYQATALAFDSKGSAVVVDDSTVRRIDVTSGKGTTLVSDLSELICLQGNRYGCYIYGPFKVQIALDGNDNIFLPDYGRSRVIRIDAQTGAESEVATGVGGPSAAAFDVDYKHLFIGLNTGSPNRVIDVPANQMAGINHPVGVFHDGWMYFTAYVKTSPTIQRVRTEPAYDILTVDPSKLLLGDVPLSQSKSQELTIRNVSSHDAVVTVSAPAVDGFSVTNDCPASLAPNQTCTAKLVFAPTDTVYGEPGMSPSGSILSVAGRGTVGNTVPFQGRAVANSALEITPASVDFGPIPIGIGPDPFVNNRQVQFRNAGPGVIKLNNPLISNSNFKINYSDCPFGQAFPAGAICTIAVYAVVPDATARTATLTVWSDTPQTPHNVPLAAQGSGPAMKLSPPGIYFYEVPVGAVAERQLTITSSGTDPLIIREIAGLPSGIVFTNGCIGTWAPGTSCVLKASYSPDSAASTIGANAQILSNAQPTSFTVSASGFESKSDPLALDFGTLPLGDTSPPQRVRLWSSDYTNNIVISLSPGFVLSKDDCYGVVRPSGICSAYVVFHPTVEGKQDGSLKITGTTGGNYTSTITVPLSGTGIKSSLSASPAGLLFGERLVGAAGTPLSVTVTNKSQTGVTINGLNVTGTDFAMTSSCGTILAPLASCTASVSFLPSAAGVHTGQLTIDSPAGSLVVSLNGTGTTPLLKISPAALDFGDQTILRTTDPKTITIQSLASGVLPLRFSTSRGFNVYTYDCFAGYNPGVAAGQTCHVKITFTPALLGANSGTLTITASPVAFLDPITDAGSPYVIALSGTGVTGSKIKLSRLSIDFGGQRVGTSSAPQSVTITNSGSDPVTLTIPAKVSDALLEHDCPAPLPGGASCTLKATYTPSGTNLNPDSWYASIKTSDSSDGLVLWFSGTPLYSMSAWSSVFPVIPAKLGSSASATASLLNTGNAPLHVSSVAMSGAGFSQSNNCPADIPPQSSAGAASCTFTVTFTPVDVGGANGQLLLKTDSLRGDTPVALAGNGLSPVTATPSSLNFGSIVVGSTATVRVLIGNTANLPVAIGSVTMSGPFQLQNDCPATLGAQSSCAISVTFAPAVTGSLSGSLVILAPNKTPLVTIPAYGSGGMPLSASPASLTFPSTTLGIPTSPLVVTLQNGSPSAVTLEEIYATVNFAQQNDCPATLAPSATCKVTVTYSGLLRNGYGSIVVRTRGPQAIFSISLTGTADVPLLANPASLVFPPTIASTRSAPLSTKLTNAATVPLAIGKIEASPPGTFEPSNDCPAMLAPGASCTVSVTFIAPQQSGSASGTLLIWTPGVGGYESIVLVGTSAFPLTANPASLSFPDTLVGSTSTLRTVLHNAGTAPITFASIDPDYVFTQTNDCPSTLSANGDCTVAITFTPTDTRAFSGSIVVRASNPAGNVVIRVSGVGTPPISATPPSVTSHATNVGETSPPVTVVLRNVGTASLTIDSVSQFFTDSPFKVQHNCTVLAPNETCTLTLTFSPTFAGGRQETLRIWTGHAYLDVPLYGVGMLPLSARENSLLFWGVSVGSTSPPQKFVVHNSGNITVTVKSVTASSPFQQQNDCGTLTPQGECTVSVTYTALTAERTVGAISVGTSIGTLDVPVTGMSGTPQLAITPSSFDFGSLPVGAYGDRAVSLVISPTTGLEKPQLTITEPGGNSDFEFSTSTDCFARTPECQFNVRFIPAALGKRTAVFKVTGTLAGSPVSAEATLTGVGIQPELTASAYELIFVQQPGVHPAQAVTLTNVSSGSLTIATVTVNQSETSVTGNCAGATLPAGGSCSLSVTWAPSVSPTSLYGWIQVTHTGATSPLKIWLAGRTPP